MLTAKVVLLFVIANTQRIRITTRLTELVDDAADQFKIEADQGDLYNTCFEQTLLFLTHSASQYLEITEDGSKGDDNLICDFNFDSVYFKTRGSLFMEDVSQLLGFDVENVTWSCKLTSSAQLCNGVSVCQTDECNCHGNHHGNKTEVFYCADGLGCIALDSLCNNVQDCADGSDECFCSEFVVLSSPQTTDKICLEPEQYCDAKIDERISPDFSSETGYHKCEDPEDYWDNLNPIDSCLDDAFRNLNTATDIAITDLAEYCRVNCSQVKNGWERFCSHIVSGYPHPYEFICDTEDWTERYFLRKLCDGEINCGNHADEIGCPGRFYCSPNLTTEWIEEDKVCDNVKDCANGTDECGTCPTNGLSSSEVLVKSNLVFAATIFMGTMIVFLNIREGYKCSTMACKSKAEKIDQVFLINVFFHDTLTGVYLCCIVLATLVLKFEGDYCQIEKIWRASSYCSCLGVLFSFSSHGSLMFIACMSITRFHTCRNIVVDIKKRTIVILSISINILNILHSFLPLMPVTAIKEIFRTEIFFTHLGENPFFSGNPINRSRLAFVHKEMLHREDDDIYRMISDLSKITSKGHIFDVMEISYYGNTGLCVHNIFKSQENYKFYKLIYCNILVFLLGLVSAAYIKIILKQREYSKAVAPSVAGAEGPDSVTSQLTLKVALIIGSQLISWIPFILSVLYFEYIASKPASELVFEIFALVVIPMNSFLNPVFHSKLYKKAMQAMWIRWTLFVNTLNRQNSSGQTRQNSIASRQDRQNSDEIE